LQNTVRTGQTLPVSVFERGCK